MQINGVALDSKCLFTVSMGTLTPASTAAATTAEQDFTVPSGTPALKTTDLVFVTGPGSGNAVALGGARVKNATTITLAFVNPTAGSLTHAAGTFGVFVARA